MTSLTFLETSTLQVAVSKGLLTSRLGWGRQRKSSACATSRCAGQARFALETSRVAPLRMIFRPTRLEPARGCPTFGGTSRRPSSAREAGTISKRGGMTKRSVIPKCLMSKSRKCSWESTGSGVQTRVKTNTNGKGTEEFRFLSRFC